MLLAVRVEAMEILFAHVSRAFLTWVTLLVNGAGELPTQKKKKLQGDKLNLHFSRENFEGLEQTREYLSHNMRVTRFRCNKMPPKL